MDRRMFNKLLPLGLILPSFTNISNPSFDSIRKSAVLKKGDSVGLITPAGPINEARLQKAINNMESLGLRVIHNATVLVKDGYLAGSDQMRLKDLHDMYKNPKVDGIWCIRGGYGTTRILDQIDFKLIKSNPKPLIGYSDITALLNTIYQKTGSPCFHGPVASSTLTDYTKAHLDPLFDNETNHKIRLSEENEIRGKEDPIYASFVINQGVAKGKLVGGNLSLLSALIGTKHCVKTKNKILFIEDVGEQPYRIDRMLSQMISAGSFNNVAGVVFGVCSGCERSNENSWTLAEVIKDRMSALDVPCMYGFSFGHIDHQCTFPIGAEAILDTTHKTITLVHD